MFTSGATTTEDIDGGRDCDDGPGECDGQLVPLGELRQRGLLEDEAWLREAPFAAEAQETDREWPDDLKPWRSSSPGYAIGAG